MRDFFHIPKTLSKKNIAGNERCWVILCRNEANRTKMLGDSSIWVTPGQQSVKLQLKVLTSTSIISFILDIDFPAPD